MSDELLKPVNYVCPYCWELIESTIDISAGTQHYIEDCTVCCNPIEISYTLNGKMIEDMRVEKAS